MAGDGVGGVVGLDYLAASRHAPGAGRYARELVRAIVARSDAPSMRLLEFGRSPAVMSDESLGLNDGTTPVRRPLPRRLLFGLVARAGLTVDRWAGGCDLFHHVVEPRPPTSSRVRSVATISEWHGEPLAWSARCADLDGVFVFSQSTADALIEHGVFPPERVIVTPVGCDHWRRDEPLRARPDDPPTLLMLGSPRQERHPRAVLAAFECLRDRGIHARLLMIGAGAERPETRDFARTLSASPHTFFIRWQTPNEAAIPALVAGCTTLVHFHAQEATPVTPLEAFSFGLSLVGSDVPAFRETLEGEATLVSPDDIHAAEHGHPEALADHFARAIEGGADEASRTRRVTLAERYTWDACAAATIAGWRQILTLPKRR